jgi:hypothetical protein
MIPADWTEKTTYDGLLTLRLPADWGQEDEEDDGTTAFGPDEDENAGVLRVTPLVYEKDHDLAPKELPRLLAKRGPQPQRVTDTRYLFHRIEEDEEDGEPLIQHTWEMVQQTGPREVVILVATYTLGLKETPKSAAPLLDALDASLRACTFDTSEDLDEDGEDFDSEDEEGEE